jgi:hypothetical protein
MAPFKRGDVVLYHDSDIAVVVEVGECYLGLNWISTRPDKESFRSNHPAYDFEGSRELCEKLTEVADATESNETV